MAGSADDAKRAADRAARRVAARASGRHPAPLNEGRSRNMQANRRSGTKPELRLRSALHAAGFRFRKDFRIQAAEVKVKPDIVFTRRRVAVFVDGCFWHNCPAHGRTPSVNGWYWNPKLQRNHERDVRVTAALEGDGWVVLRFWEHESLDDVVTRVTDVLTTPAPGPHPPKITTHAPEASKITADAPPSLKITAHAPEAAAPQHLPGRSQ